MRLILVIFAAALVASPALAQKPGADPAQEQWRAQTLPVCTAGLATAEGVTPDELATICGCATGRYLDTHQAGPLPAIDAAQLRTELGGRILSCTIQELPARASAVSRWFATRGAIAPPVIAEPGLQPAAVDKPAADGEDNAAPPSSRNGLDPGGWWESLRSRVAGSGLPLWAWLPIIVFVLLVLRGLSRRRDRPDLVGPPRR